MEGTYATNTGEELGGLDDGGCVSVGRVVDIVGEPEALRRRKGHG